MIKTNEHDEIYQKLQSLGYKGWGGKNYDYRMNGWDDNLNKIFGFIKLETGKVLELGCGAGDVSLKLAQMGFDVTGVDISPTAVKWAQKKSQSLSNSIDFIAQNVCEPTLLEGMKFDLIIDGNCLHCLFDDERVAFYNNVKRLLKESGNFFIGSAILSNEDDPIPKLSSIERCVITKEKLESELMEMGFIKKKSWISKHETHSHYRGIYVYA